MKNYKLFDNEGYEYDMFVEKTEEGTVYTLKYGNNKDWTDPGSVAMKATDTGDGFEFSFTSLGNNMDYGLFGELYVMMAFIRKSNENEWHTYTAYETTNIIL